MTTFLFVQMWLTSVDAKPGLNKIMLDMLERRYREDQPICETDVGCSGHKKTCATQSQYSKNVRVCGDGRWVQWDRCCLWDSRVYGCWHLESSTCLLFSPETLKVFVVHALEELRARGLRVVCMTMDGHASSISMCNQFGELKGNPHKPLKTFFPHPVTGESVHHDGCLPHAKDSTEHATGKCWLVFFSVFNSSCISLLWCFYICNYNCKYLRFSVYNF